MGFIEHPSKNVGHSCSHDIEYRVDPNGCWIVTSHTKRGRKGYPRICIGHRTITISRFIYERYVGSIPEGMCICHTCDNRSCVNPDHLFLGTLKDNYQDAKAKNRHSHGVRHGMSKLDEGKVRMIRKLATTSITQREIARKFGIDQTNVSFVVRRKTWAHVV